jgi:hypothetical protein
MVAAPQAEKIWAPQARGQPKMGPGAGRWWLILGHLLAIPRTSAVFRHSGPSLYPLAKSVGHQTSTMSFPTTCDAHTISVGQKEAVCLDFTRAVAECNAGETIFFEQATGKVLEFVDFPESFNKIR